MIRFVLFSETVDVVDDPVPFGVVLVVGEIFWQLAEEIGCVWVVFSASLSTVISSVMESSDGSHVELLSPVSPEAVCFPRRLCVAIAPRLPSVFGWAPVDVMLFVFITLWNCARLDMKMCTFLQILSNRIAAVIK